MDNQSGVDARGASLVTKISLDKNASGLTGWLVKGMLVGSDFPGFVSAEILPPDNEQTTQWTIVQRFRDKSQLQALKDSPQQKTFLNDLHAAFINNVVLITHDEQSRLGAAATVTAAIVTHVKPGHGGRVQNLGRSGAISPGKICRLSGLLFAAGHRWCRRLGNTFAL